MRERTVTDQDEGLRYHDQHHHDDETDRDFFQRVPFRMTTLRAHRSVAHRGAAFCARAHKCLRNSFDQPPVMRISAHPADGLIEPEKRRKVPP